MPHLTPVFGSIQIDALAFVLGGCKKPAPVQQQQSMGPVVVNCPPCQCAAPQPQIAAPAPQESIATSVQVAGY